MVKPSLTGVVISQGKMAKTVKVRIQKLRWNSVVSKYVVDHKNMLVHDELDKCREGDVVRVQYVRPLSARKSWAVAEIMKLKGTSWQKYQEVIPEQVREDELQKLKQFRDARLQREKLDGQDPVVAELRLLEQSLNGAESGLSAEKVQELKAKYNLEAWPPAHEVVRLDLAELEEQTETLHSEIQGTQKYTDEARRLLAESPAEADEIIKSLGKDPSVLKAGIKRNIIAKHLRKSA
ncbi:37S ribosomal protein S17, mitochondrial [Wickerhamiella sorbophila]|uniref:37S ribosomal protein S17, mitochondrial n=1 Tax=Wickerhamiella sorbophila TaxID=45607 RepID=A0A2T0FNA5_9ASCO|nr:37S ribosomal protein S17, mitochondrial [Wickerhamiella sorbophila]PRT56455.1 37S ribosomal protein S17, mitochondrial [Wickerhamiella sorbophila]